MILPVALDMLGFLSVGRVSPDEHSRSASAAVRRGDEPRRGRGERKRRASRRARHPASRAPEVAKGLAAPATMASAPSVYACAMPAALPDAFRDLSFAAGLVARATRLAVEARRDLPSDAIVRKPDGSIVTAVDVALQVLILTELERRYGAHPVIAEEDLASIGGKPAAEACCRGLLRAWDPSIGEEACTRALGSGGLDGRTGGLEALWILDPIDGTRGFVEGDHWCPCLALVSHGRTVFAVNGHPTVLEGATLVAESGAGTWWTPLAGGDARRTSVETRAPAGDEAVCVVAPANPTPAQLDARRAIGESTGHPCRLVRSDSQAKYAHVIAGLADIAYSRRGGGPGKFVWDHAGAILLAREAGAWVGDTDGGDIDLTRGRRISANDAVICAARGLGPAVAAALHARDVEEGFAAPRHARAMGNG